MPNLTEEMIAELPPPVQRSVRRAGVVGRAIPTGVVVRQQGKIRTSAESRWLNFTARESYSADRPGFLWKAALKIGPLTTGRATDTLRDGHGRMHVKLLGMVKVVDTTGPELNQGALMRWLNETMWFPAVWATDVITWEPIDRNSAVGSVTDGALTVSGEFRFDDEGRLVGFHADRYRAVDDGFEMTEWATPLKRHAVFNGFELPAEGRGVWNLDGGDFEYIQIRVDDVKYE